MEVSSVLDPPVIMEEQSADWLLKGMKERTFVSTMTVAV